MLRRRAEGAVWEPESGVPGALVSERARHRSRNQAILPLQARHPELWCCPGGDMDIRKTFLEWPVVRQLTSKDPLGRGSAVQSQHTRAITPRTKTADRVVQSVCPYCAVGCGQRVFVKDEHVVQIEGDPDSPVSRGRLCPKGSASEQLVNSPGRATTMLYRRPRSTSWEKIGVERATDMIAARRGDSRRKHWQDTDEEGRP